MISPFCYGKFDGLNCVQCLCAISAIRSVSQSVLFSQRNEITTSSAHIIIAQLDVLLKDIFFCRCFCLTMGNLLFKTVCSICLCAPFLSVMEKFTENTRFCLICNYLTKIIPALQSRCTRFRFGPLENEQMTSRLQHVISAEGLVCRNANAEVFTLPHEGLMKKNNYLKNLQVTMANIPDSRLLLFLLEIHCV